MCDVIVASRDKALPDLMRKPSQEKIPAWLLCLPGLFENFIAIG